MNGRSPSDHDSFDLSADAYRRRISCRTLDLGTVVADLEDDFHHFRVTLSHDQSIVSSIECESIRWPWITCPEAARNLQPLVGMPLAERFTAAAERADPRQNCTHQFDCAAHAVVHAVRSADERRYDVEVPNRDRDGRTRARLWVDGQVVWRWTLEWSHLVDADPPLPGAPDSGFMTWADRTLDAETAEAAIVLRRGTVIGMGRGWPFDDYDNAGQVEIGQSGVCYTMTAGRSDSAVRMHGMIRDFSRHPERLDRESCGENDMDNRSDEA